MKSAEIDIDLKLETVMLFEQRKAVCMRVFLLAVLISFSWAQANEIENYSIEIKMYRAFPPVENFTAMYDLGWHVAKETAKGFIKKAVIKKQAYHTGVTYCLIIDPSLSDANFQFERILNLLRALKPEGQYVQYKVSSPSNCLKE